MTSSTVILDSLCERPSKEVLCIEALTKTGKAWLVGTPLKATQLYRECYINNIFFRTALQSEEVHGSEGENIT